MRSGRLHDLSATGPLPLLIYSEGTGLQVKYPIWYNTMSNTTCSSWYTLTGATRPDLVGWATSDDTAHILSSGTGGISPHTSINISLSILSVLATCNTLGVCHQLNSGFELKHDMLSGDEGVKFKPVKMSPNLNLDHAPLLTC
jgi:hypothetical protein